MWSCVIVLFVALLLLWFPTVFSLLGTVSTCVMHWRYHHFITETRTLALTLHVTSNLRVSSLDLLCAPDTVSRSVSAPLLWRPSLGLMTLVRAEVSSRIAGLTQ